MTTYTATIIPQDNVLFGAFSVRLTAAGIVRAKREAETLATEHLDARERDGKRRGWAVVRVYVRDDDGDVIDRHQHYTGRAGWRSIGAYDAKPAPCKRCGGHGWESVMDTHCYACGRHGARTRAWHAAQDKRASE